MANKSRVLIVWTYRSFFNFKAASRTKIESAACSFSYKIQYTNEIVTIATDYNNQNIFTEYLVASLLKQGIFQQVQLLAEVIIWTIKNTVHSVVKLETKYKKHLHCLILIYTSLCKAVLQGITQKQYDTSFLLLYSKHYKSYCAFVSHRYDFFFYSYFLILMPYLLQNTLMLNTYRDYT